jgi:hypothetical protein
MDRTQSFSEHSYVLSRSPDQPTAERDKHEPLLWPKQHWGLGVSTGLISQVYWEQIKWYFVNVEHGNIADKLQPRNINVSFTNNSNVPIDVIIFTFYSDQLTIDVETGIVTK